MNDEPQHKHRKYWLLCVFAVFIAILGVVLPETEFTPLTYINASNISYSGLVNVNGNLSDISEINNGNWSADESTTPWWINITFTNVTHFSFPEIKLLYFSTVGASTHVNDIEIYCITEHTFVDLSSFTNQIEWLYWTRHVPDSMHFVDANGNVTIRFNHSSNGNTNHRIKLDVVRLVEQSQFETVTTTLIQYFNTTTTGTGSQNLSQVLGIGNDAEKQNITNVQSISMTGKLNISITNGTYTGFNIFGTGGQTPFFTAYENNSILRTEITLGGSQVWRLRDLDTAAGAPVGYIAYGTPGGLPGIILYNSTLKRRTNMFMVSGGGSGYGLLLNSVNDTTFKTTGVLVDTQDNITVSGLKMSGSGNYSIVIADSTGKLIAVPMNGTGNHYGCFAQNGYPYPGNPGC